jgi:hypothetical protein
MGPMSGHRFRRAGVVAVLCAAAVLVIFILGRGARRDPGEDDPASGRTASAGTFPSAAADSGRKRAGAGASPKSVPRLLPATARERGQYYPTRTVANAGQPSDFKLAIYQAIPPVKQCYSTLLEQDPTADGAFSIRVKIRRGRDGKGELADATFESPRSGLEELNAPLFQQCVLGALARLELPAPRGGREEEEQVVPFNFGGLSGDERYRRQNVPDGIGGIAGSDRSSSSAPPMMRAHRPARTKIRLPPRQHGSA